MIKQEKILLPGLGKQLQFLIDNLKLDGLSILVIGSASENIALELAELSGVKTHLIVEDFDSLMTSNLVIDNNPDVQVKMMDFERTDFAKESFDLVFAQASISLTERNKIVKEIKRVLKPGGILCVGELVTLEEDIPRFVEDIFDNSGMVVLNRFKLNNYYTERGFKILFEKNLTDTLRNYYTINLKKLGSEKEKLGDNEKTYFKKVINKISHESGAFLKQGADKYIGFKAIICKRGEN
jgi:SAM-dependent methyltransferase